MSSPSAAGFATVATDVGAYVSGAPGGPAPRPEPGILRRLATPRRVAAAAVLLALAGLLRLAPVVESLPGDEPAADVPPAEDSVVVVHRGRTLVYDKRRSWISAKAAEWFPNVVPDYVPADLVADERGVLRERTLRIRPREPGGENRPGSPPDGESPGGTATSE